MDCSRCQIDIKTGGTIVTNYDTTKKLDDSSSIKLGIINYLENDMINLKVNLNDNFPLDAKRRIKTSRKSFSSSIWEMEKQRLYRQWLAGGQGTHWDKTYSFFEKVNDWTFKEMLKPFN